MVGVLTRAQLLSFANGFAGPRDPRMSFELPVLVGAEDLDHDGARRGRFPASLVDFARVLPWWRGARARVLARRAWRSANGASQVFLSRALGPDELFRLRTTLASWDRGWLYFEQLLVAAEGPCARVRRQARFVTPDGPVPSLVALGVVGIDGVEAAPVLPWVDALRRG